MRNDIILIMSRLALVLLATTGCYSFQGGRLEFSTVAVPVAENASSEFRLPEIVTAAVISAVNRDGRVKISDVGRSETILQVTITSFSRTAYQYTSQEQVKQYRTAISAKATLSTSGGRVLWRSDGLNGWYVHPAEELEEEGMKKAADNLAAEILRQGFEPW